MPKGQLYINDVDAYTEYGISLNEAGLSTLITFPERKDFVKNEVRTEHGTRYNLTSPPCIKEREVTLYFHMYANNSEHFNERLNTLKELFIATVEIKLRTSFEPNVCYRLLYVSCLPLTQFRQEYALIGIKFVEPNPNNRSL